MKKTKRSVQKWSISLQGERESMNEELDWEIIIKTLKQTESKYWFSKKKEWFKGIQCGPSPCFPTIPQENIVKIIFLYKNK